MKLLSPLLHLEYNYSIELSVEQMFDCVINEMLRHFAIAQKKPQKCQDLNLIAYAILQIFRFKI